MPLVMRLLLLLPLLLLLLWLLLLLLLLWLLLVRCLGEGALLLEWESCLQNQLRGLVTVEKSRALKRKQERNYNIIRQHIPRDVDFKTLCCPLLIPV